MKKSKKALLWTIVPVLGVSSGVAGAVAGVTNQKTSVDTNNVATPGSATTMATKSSSQVVNGLRIGIQPIDTLTMSGEDTSMFVHVDGQQWSSKLRYVWKVNKGDDKGWKIHTSGGRGHTGITVPKTNTLLSWTFKCEIKDERTGWQATTNEVILTIAPQDGRYIRVTKQPEARKTVSGGQKVELTTEAKGTNKYEKSKIGYQWFEYDGSNDRFTEIQGATNSTYTFTAPSNTTTTTTKKYVCRYYIADDSKSRTYLSQSSQSVVTIDKDAEEVITVSSPTATQSVIGVGGTTTLSVEAKSSKTNNLKYQWWKSYSEGEAYKPVSDPSSSPSFQYTATKEDAGKNLLFSVLVSGTEQDGKLNHFQSKDVVVKVNESSQTIGSATSGTFTNDLSVKSSVTTSQASVRSTFNPIGGLVKTPEYKVDVKGETGLTYKWYYVSPNGTKNLIKDANDSTLKTNKSLFEAAYKDNDKHKVGIVCEIYKGTDLIKTIDSTTNRSFYMTVVIARR